MNNYCYMFAKFNMPPDFKGFCTNRRSHYGKTNLYNTYYQWVSVYFMIQVKHPQIEILVVDKISRL